MKAGAELSQMLCAALFETRDVGAALEKVQRQLVLRELEPLAVEEAEQILRRDDDDDPR